MSSANLARLLDVSGAVTHEPVPSDQVLAGAPTSGHRSLASVHGVEVGVWEITAGTVTDTEVDEVFVVLSGAGTVTFADGEQIRLAPGVAVRLRAGEQTTWTISETLRKVYLS